MLGPRLRYLPSSRELRYLQPAYLESNTEQDGGPGLCPREGAVSHCLGTWLLQARTDPDCSLLVPRPPGGQLLGQKDLPSEMKRVKKKPKTHKHLNVSTQPHCSFFGSFSGVWKHLALPWARWVTSRAVPKEQLGRLHRSADPPLGKRTMWKRLVPLSIRGAWGGGCGTAAGSCGKFFSVFV